MGIAPAVVVVAGLAGAGPLSYAWTTAAGASDTLATRIPPPAGFVRDAAPPRSLATWLRGLPLRPGRGVVRLHDGRPKWTQDLHHAVLDLDVGPRDLQQCADAVMRLRAEYLHAAGLRDDLRFHLTNGDEVTFAQWAAGLRPRVTGSRVRQVAAARPDASHRSLRTWLDMVFTYAGTSSLLRDTRPVALAGAAPGDVLLQGGFPGHAVLVLDVARRPADGALALLLAQGYMPAQDVHVLRNLADPRHDPWYVPGDAPRLVTPEWTFDRTDLRRFRGS
jgi:hypothetical protein